MANEISLSIDFSASKGSYDFRFRPGTLRVDLTNALDSGQVQVIGTAWEVVTVSPDIATAGYAIFRNVNTGAQYVDVATGSTSSPAEFTRLRTGEIAVLPLAGTTLAARAQTSASTATVPLFVRILAR